MRRLTTFLACGVTCLLLGGCFGGGATPERTYYSLTYATQSSGTRYRTARYPFMLRVKRFDSALAYDKQEIVYRQNPYEFKYYPYRLWSSKPRKMLREMLATHVRRSNLVSDVVVNVTDKLPKYVLEGEILAIEELDSTEGQWYAHLAMRFTMKRFDDNKRVWEFHFDEKRSVPQRQPVFVVQVLSEILEQQFNRVTAGVDRYLESAHAEYPAPERIERAAPSAIRTPQLKTTPKTKSSVQPKARLIR